MTDKETFYVTTAIDYPNGKPHIGHAFEKIIADILARWNAQKGKDVFYATGTDEHGQKLEKYANEANKTPKVYVDEKVIAFKELCKKLNIRNDAFIRTTDLHHEEFAKELFQKVLDKGEITLGKYAGNYCIYDETFFTDKDLVEGKKCPQCLRETQVVEEEAYFFNMGKYQNKIIELIETNEFEILPKTRRNEILSRLKHDELRKLCVSRTTFSWGIPLKNNPEHVIYVWFDALINYITALQPEMDASKYWPADVHVIGKDIIWFHTVIWPAMLLALDIPLPKKVYAHGFILAKGGDKMSKSKGNALDPMAMLDEYGSDAMRYYLSKVVPSADDGQISIKELIEKYNGELANDLGNLVMRCVKLSLKRIGKDIEIPANYINPLQESITSAYEKADGHLGKCEYDRALEVIWSVIKKTNVYLNEKEPWKVKDEKEFHTIMYTALDNLSQATAMLKPFIPTSCEKIESQLGINLTFTELEKQKTFKLTDEGALFPKIEIEASKNEVFGAQKTETFSSARPEFSLNLKVAKIESVEEHPDAEKLFVMQMNLGDEKRQLVAGLKGHYSKEELVGKQVVMLSNLKPAKLRGVQSEGMILAGEDSGVVKVLEAPDSDLGSQVLINGYEIKQDRITIDDVQKNPLTIKKGKVLTKDNIILKTEKEDVKVDLVQGKVY